MAIDEVPENESTMESNARSGSGLKFVVVFLVLAALAVGEIYTLNRMGTMHGQLTAQQNQLREDLTGQMRTQLTQRLNAIEQQNAAQFDAVKAELDQAGKRMGAQGGELKRARNMVSQLQSQQREQTDQLKLELAQKADQQQVGELTKNVSSTRTDLDSTKQTVSSLASDLGMARSSMGTLIARNHDDIEYLRKLGDRDYFEFTLTHNQLAKVAGVGLTLKKTNPKRYRYSVNMMVDDMQVERKDCTVNSPVYFYVNGSKRPFELVVNKVDSSQVKGYLSTPKGANTEVASRTDVAHQ